MGRQIAGQRPAIMRRTPWAPALYGPVPQMYSMYRDDSDFVVFCFAKPEDAGASAKLLWRSVAGDLDVSRKLTGLSKGVAAEPVQRFLERLIAQHLMMRPRRARNGATLNLSSPE
jgi:hypothetical protein